MKELILGEECYQIIGACFEVYREKGCGFLEAVFHECLELEFRSRNIPYESKVGLVLKYKGQELKQRYFADFVCFGKVLLEIKAAQDLAPEHCSQVLNYLNATGLKLGLLVNFGHFPALQWKRVVL
ncbi:MAG TPA: GxxExxY protein [Opitutaceae bacterium]|nr:GxxExxY protein [Opitutaceae bacterium]